MPSRNGKIRQAFGKGLPLAMLIQAAETPHSQNKLDDMTADRQVLWGARVITMDTSRNVLTRWANRFGTGGICCNGQDLPE
ncbi:MAG: hypothetical protein WCE52_17770, partial [Candidatus Acidiferrum sp.]